MYGSMVLHDPMFIIVSFAARGERHNDEQKEEKYRCEQGHCKREQVQK